jgi:hypothetical protein
MMDADKPEQTSVNDSGTEAASDTGLTQQSSRTVLEQTRRDLIVMRAKHGADSPIGCRCSNIVELIQMPEVPAALVARQMADLQQLLAAQ